MGVTTPHDQAQRFEPDREPDQEPDREPGRAPWGNTTRPVGRSGEARITSGIVRQEAQEQARRYEQWLAQEWLRADDSRRESAQALTEYVNEASQELTHHGQRYLPFAPYERQKAFSALRTFTGGQLVTLALLALALIAALTFVGTQALTFILGALTAFYLLDLVITAAIATRTLHRLPTVVIEDAVTRAVRDDFWPHYTVLCPLYHEAEVAEQFVRAMRLIDYPTNRLQILFLTEEDDTQTREALSRMTLPRHFEIVTVPAGNPRTKPRACNYGLLKARGEYIVIFDAEDIPDPLQLKKAVLTFAHYGPKMVCVQASLNFYNPRQNLLTRWFTAEYSLWFDLTLPALQRMRTILPLGGTSNHFRTRILREVGGWDPFNVTEDCDLGVRLAQYRFRTAMLDSTTYEEANPALKNWLWQRSRWVKGYMQTYLTHMRDPLRYVREGRLWELFWLQIIVGGRTFTQLINPILWLMTLAYVVFHQELVAPYHVLYPGPLFYAAAFCLVFGNLFYVYSYLIGCLNRRQYTLTLWSLLIPVYWLLMSVAAYVALFQLLTRPHYWAKTRHGLSHPDNLPPTLQNVWLQGLADDVRQGVSWVATRMPLKTPLIAPDSIGLRARPSSGWAPQTPVADIPLSVSLPVEPVVDMFSTARLPALESAERTLDISTRERRRVMVTASGMRPDGPQLQLKQRSRFPLAALLADGWLMATLLTAITASVAACVYFFTQNDLLLYNDAESHMRLARLVFYSATPGLAQLGSNWLPLPHILMWPFVWNDYLWRTGLAGALAAAPCYVVAAVYTFLCAREVTGNGAASYAGALVLILNPNVLYLQTTPLSEATLLAVTAATSYYFLRWARSGETKPLLGAAVCALLGVMTRYEGWSLFAALILMVVVVDLVKRLRLRRIVGDVAVFALPGSTGIALWFLWDYLLTGNPRYFQNGPYSPIAQQTLLKEAGALPTYHQPVLDLITFGADLIQYFGPVIIALGVVGLVVFGVTSWRKPLGVASLALLAPIVLYLVSLYSGQTVIYAQGVMPSNIQDPIFNVRYATSAAIPLAIFLAQLTRSWRWTQIALVVAILAQSALTATGGIISLQDGQYGKSCLAIKFTDAFLLEHYNGLPIMLDTFAGPHNFATLGIDMRKVIYEGNYRLWQAATADPAAYVDWVVITPHDTVDKSVMTDEPSFTEHFRLVALSSDGSRIYYSNSAPPLPVRPLPADIFAAHARCPGTVSPGRPSSAPGIPSPSGPQEGPHASITFPALTALDAPFRLAISLTEGAHA